MSLYGMPVGSTFTCGGPLLTPAEQAAYPIGAVPGQGTPAPGDNPNPLSLGKPLDGLLGGIV
jgi:hypothetical protein